MRNTCLYNKDIVSLPKQRFQNAHHVHCEKSLARTFAPTALKTTTSKCREGSCCQASSWDKWPEASAVAPEGGLWVSLTAWWPMTSFHRYILNSRNRAENHPDPPRLAPGTRRLCKMLSSKIHYSPAGSTWDLHTVVVPWARGRLFVPGSQCRLLPL